MNTLLHNFSAAFRRFRFTTVLNILGMSVAFAVFLILMMQVTYEWGFDRFHRDADSLFRLEITHGEQGAQACLSRPLFEAFVASSPHVEESALLNGFTDKVSVSVERAGEQIPFYEMMLPVTDRFADLFEFEMVEGERSALSIPGQVLIPQSMAQRFFGSSPALGERLQGEGWSVTVGGVYRDMPSNSIVQNAIYQKMADEVGAGAWKQNNFEGYLRLNDASVANELLNQFRQNFRHEQLDWKTMDLRLVSLHDVYFETNVSFDTQKQKGSYTLLRLLSGIALLIIVIAAINFTNFSNAQVPMRLKSVNTQKVLGCPVSRIRLSIIAEAVGIVLLSYLVSIFWVQLLSRTAFRDIVVGGISLEGQGTLLLAGGVLVILVGVISSCYPAYYITSFQPAMVLKGNFGLSPKGRKLRNVLVCMQFFVSFILIICALFVYLQNHSMLRMPLGFDKEQIVVLDNLTNKMQNSSELIRQRLSGVPGVESVALVSHLVGATDNYGQMGRSYQGKMITFLLVKADPSVLDVLGVKPTEGRNFRPEDETGTGVYIFNEMARKQYGLKPGDVLSFDMEWDGGGMHLREPVIGFIPDLKYNSFRSITEPFAFYVGPNTPVYGASKAMIRTGAHTNLAALKADLTEALHDVDPNYLPEIRLFDEMQDYLYEKELRVGRQVAFFSFVAVLISLIGVFGVVMLESEYKRKEVGIRKVFGATVGELLQMFNRNYFRIALGCFVVAVPVAYYAIARWQEGFVYKVGLSWWIFLLAFLLVTSLTLLTVSIQSWRVANANPVDSLKSE